jgi:NADP-dependent 3-hydroxy acid dehydrogenase YdfG
MSAIKDKVVVVTGSSRGFGYAIAESMLVAGAVVAITGRNQDAVDRALNGLQPKGRVNGFVMDIAKKNKSTSWLKMSSRNLATSTSGSTTQAIPTRRA